LGPDRGVVEKAGWKAMMAAATRAIDFARVSRNSSKSERLTTYVATISPISKRRDGAFTSRCSRKTAWP
jgi:hypothetical protein